MPHTLLRREHTFYIGFMTLSVALGLGVNPVCILSIHRFAVHFVHALWQRRRRRRHSPSEERGRWRTSANGPRTTQHVLRRKKKMPQEIRSSLRTAVQNAKQIHVHEPPGLFHAPAPARAAHSHSPVPPVSHKIHNRMNDPGLASFHPLFHSSTLPASVFSPPPLPSFFIPHLLHSTKRRLRGDRVEEACRQQPNQREPANTIATPNDQGRRACTCLLPSSTMTRSFPSRPVSISTRPFTK